MGNDINKFNEIQKSWESFGEDVTHPTSSFLVCPENEHVNLVDMAHNQFPSTQLGNAFPFKSNLDYLSSQVKYEHLHKSSERVGEDATCQLSMDMSNLDTLCELPSSALSKRQKLAVGDDQPDSSRSLKKLDDYLSEADSGALSNQIGSSKWNINTPFSEGKSSSYIIGSWPNIMDSSFQPHSNQTPIFNYADKTSLNNDILVSHSDNQGRQPLDARIIHYSGDTNASPRLTSLPKHRSRSSSIDTKCDQSPLCDGISSARSSSPATSEVEQEEIPLIPTNGNLEETSKHSEENRCWRMIRRFSFANDEYLCPSILMKPVSVRYFAALSLSEQVIGS
ncbi:unnamed protein product [Protopolystoma xenopodis]|uniref:Uncharacterized protein n=1 Tax=Protopolystoma xenopodis TaxID=117903 RepID=A0A3S5AZJ4_9PLAT|nr:unnamed protein product [Protopolystoma xenopodis]